MRNKYISCYVAAFCAGLLSTACNDFLDEVPDNRTVIDTPEAVSELLVSAYPDANCVFFTESMSDNVTDRGNTLDPYVQPEWNRANRQAFYWEDIDMTYQDSPNYFWMASYQAIAAANHALEAIAELEAKGVDCSVQKGEALLCRAYNHFMLVNVFAQHYNPAFAATDMGVAYVTEPEKEVFGHYERVSVKDTYDRIRKDLEEGLPLISNKAYGDTPKYHFTREAAQAFAVSICMSENGRKLSKRQTRLWEITRRCAIGTSISRCLQPTGRKTILRCRRVRTCCWHPPYLSLPWISRSIVTGILRPSTIPCSSKMTMW